MVFTFLREVLNQLGERGLPAASPVTASRGDRWRLDNVARAPVPPNFRDACARIQLML